MITNVIPGRHPNPVLLGEQHRRCHNRVPMPACVCAYIFDEYNHDLL